jgi:amino acid adenylation domain-containing protein
MSYAASPTPPEADRGIRQHPIDAAVIPTWTIEVETVPMLVSASASAFPTAIAVRSGDREVAYAELDSRAKQLAHHMLSMGLRTGQVVGVFMERSVEMIVAALAAWKAGCAYLPIDPDLPRSRLDFILDEVQAPLLLVGPKPIESIAAGKTRVERVALDELAGFPYLPTTPAIAVRGDDLAYVIYTSGSTGRPKGAQITHSNLLNLVRWHNRAFSVRPADRASHLAGLGFDAAVWELWPYLTAGATVVLAPEDVRSSADALWEWLIKERITTSFVPTPLAEILIHKKWPADASLRVLLTGGDTLHSHPSADLPFAFFNNYGPTECTVVATAGPVFATSGADGLPSIGVPIDNTEIYILDDTLAEVPEGTTGELCIAGAGVGRGYVGPNSGMIERFVNVNLGPKGHKRIYRTGDLARRLPNGEIAFMGRIDEQIKIRGYRIEPAEIVRCLNELPEIQASAVVAASENGGDPCLIAYLVPGPNATLRRQAIQESLLRSLPDYMVPAIFVLVDSLPLNANGKVDRSALPQPSEESMLKEDPSDIPETLLQGRIQQIVGSLLGLDAVDINENFFLMGGHSLLGTQLIARIRDEFGVDIKLRTLFASPTVVGLSTEVEGLILAKLESETPQRGEAASGM